MKFQDRSQIEALAKFKGQGDLVTSFYMDTDKGRMSRKEIQLALKNLLNEAKDRACGLSISKEKTESVLRDLDLIADYGSQTLGTSNAAGLAVFSASQQKFWQPLELPHGPRSRIIFDANFYVRPLASILDKYSHICALLIDRREAVWYDVSMGEIKFLDKLLSDVPSKVRDGGFEGTSAKRIERHIDAHLQEHYKKTAQKTFELSKNVPSIGSSSARRKITARISNPTCTAISAIRSRPGCIPARAIPRPRSSRRSSTWRAGSRKPKRR